MSFFTHIKFNNSRGEMADDGIFALDLDDTTIMPQSSFDDDAEVTLIDLDSFSSFFSCAYHDMMSIQVEFS